MDYVVSQFPATGGFPKPEGPSLVLTDLRPADILLSRGNSDVARAIVAADGGSYSHAALWSGSGIIEATLEGMSEHPFTGERDVYRHRELAAEHAPLIVEEARRQLGSNYAYSELLLLGCLLRLGLRPQRPTLDVLVKALAGSRGLRLLQRLEQLLEGRAPRVCTELVALSYFRPEQQRYALKVIPRKRPSRSEQVVTSVTHAAIPASLTIASSAATMPGSFTIASSAAALPDGRALRDEAASHPRAEPADDSWSLPPEWEELSKACSPLVEGEHPLRLAPANTAEFDQGAALQAARVLAGAIAIHAETGARLGVVTPANLQFSPSLEFVGRTAER